jgi:hypothetical protein
MTNDLQDGFLGQASEYLGFIPTRIATIEIPYLLDFAVRLAEGVSVKLLNPSSTAPGRFRLWNPPFSEAISEFLRNRSQNVLANNLA